MLRKRKMGHRPPQAHSAYRRAGIAFQHRAYVVHVVERAGQTQIVAPKVRGLGQQRVNNPALSEIQRDFQALGARRPVHRRRLGCEFQPGPAWKPLFARDDMQRVGVPDYVRVRQHRAHPRGGVRIARRKVTAQPLRLTAQFFRWIAHRFPSHRPPVRQSGTSSTEEWVGLIQEVLLQLSADPDAASERRPSATPAARIAQAGRLYPGGWSRKTKTHGVAPIEPRIAR